MASLQAARLERARRWLQAGQSLNDYPTLDAGDETEAMLAAEQGERGTEKKPKAPNS